MVGFGRSICHVRVQPALAILACSLVLVASAGAQETGSVAGGVFDVRGAPVADATIQITSDALGTVRSAVTSDKGLFVILLPPGQFTAVAEKATVGRMTRAIVVDVGRETRCDFILGALTVDPVTVTATATPDLDLKPTGVSFSYRRALVENLPLERSYLGLMQLIPGVADNNGLAPNGGSSHYDNTYLLDGVNITNPFFGYLSSEINELDIAQLDVRRGAIRPEFGRSIGLFNNAILKSGTNVFTGNFRFEAIPGEWIAASTKSIHAPTSRWDTAGAVGGPVVKDRLFYYGSAHAVRSTSLDAVNSFGPIPNRVEQTTELFGKLTARLGMHIVNGSYRGRPTTIEFAGLGPHDSPEVASDVERSTRVASITDDWFAGNRTTLSLTYAHVGERNESVAVTDLGFQPPFNEDNFAALGHVVIGGIAVGGASLKLDRQDYARDEIKAVASRHFDVRRTSHYLKAGLGWDQGIEDLTRQSNGWGDISFVFIEDQLRIRATNYPEQPSQHSTGHTYSAFVQDDVTFGDRIIADAGLLLNRDAFVQATGSGQSTFPTFGFGDELQPRLGVTVQLRRGKDKAYFNWGRYFGMDQKSGARAVAAGRLYTQDTDFDPETGAIVSQVVTASTGPKSVMAGLDPPLTNEIVAGYETPLRGGWVLDAFWLSRHTDRFIEDVPTVLPFSAFQFQNDPFGKRNYDTAVVELRRRLQDLWSVDASYAWSRLSGNYDQDYSEDFTGAPLLQTSSLIDDGPGAFTSDQYRSGVLSQDRTHVYKVLATWSPAQVEPLTVGLFVRGQSGTPWEARALPWNSSVTYLRLLESAGSHRTPFWTNVDLLLKYTKKLTSRRGIHIEGRILNLLNQETVLQVDQRKYLDPRNLGLIGSPTPGCWSCFTEAYIQGVKEPNQNFGQPIAYAQPRRLLVSVLVDF